MRSWIGVACCMLLLSCASNDADTSQGSVSTGEARDGGARDTPILGGSAVGSRSDRDGSAGEAPEGTPLRELTTTQLSALCDEVAEVFGDELSETELDRLGCVVDAMYSVDYEEVDGEPVLVEAQCREHVADCITASAGTSFFLCETDGFRAAAMTCGGTLEAYRACTEAGASAFGDAVPRLTCETLASPDDVKDAVQARVQLDPFSHEACVDLIVRCPGLFGGMTRGEPAEGGCDETCVDSNDGYCDDGGPDAQTSLCALGTDCSDCGRRD